MLEAQPNVASDRCVLVGLYNTDSALTPDALLDELSSLVEAAGAIPVARIIQRRGISKGENGPSDRPMDAATYIGRGKVEQVAEAVETLEANVVVFDNDLSPAQIRELEKRVKARVLDRSELILDIFASRARTREARIQIDVAQLEYTAPRLRGMWTHLERQAGNGSAAGVGGRGPGEQQIEIDRRIVTARLALLKAELKKIHKRRERQVVARTSQAWSVGLVGYTNAGKSTLLNALTSADTYAADKLFATLDTISRRWEVRPGVAIPLSDTVGFVRDLPHHLVASFRSTLAETLHADLLLHVVDASHPEAKFQVEAVHNVLRSLDVPEERVLGVLNKADQVTDPFVLSFLRGAFQESVTVSAVAGTGLDELAAAVVKRRSSDWAELLVDIPHDQARLAALIHEHGEVKTEVWDDDGWHASVSIPKAMQWQLEGVSRPAD